MIRGIPAAQYGDFRDDIWPFLLGFADRERDGTTAHDLESGVIARDRQVWCINDFQALALTTVAVDAVRITHCAGVRRHEWQEAFDDEIRAWAKALGKPRIIALVRPGWARFGLARGYREIHREMMLEL